MPKETPTSPTTALDALLCPVSDGDIVIVIGRVRNIRECQPGGTNCTIDVLNIATHEREAGIAFHARTAALVRAEESAQADLEAKLKAECQRIIKVIDDRAEATVLTNPLAGQCGGRPLTDAEPTPVLADCDAPIPNAMPDTPAIDPALIGSPDPKPAA